MLMRVKMNVFTLQKHYFYTTKTMLLACIINLLPNQLFHSRNAKGYLFPTKSLEFFSKSSSTLRAKQRELHLTTL